MNRILITVLMCYVLFFCINCSINTEMIHDNNHAANSIRNNQCPYDYDHISDNCNTDILRCIN
jgi:hypothetical protein